MSVRLAAATALAFTLSACAVHHVTPYVPDARNAPQSADAAAASASCAEASTAAETAICANPDLVAANHAMVAGLQLQLRGATIFGRDALMASQRAWLLGLPAQCGLPGALPSASTPCLQSALAARQAALAAWPAPPPVPGNATAQYVSLRPASGAGPQPDPAFCPVFAQRANAALARLGTLDPAAMGYQEVAGVHGPDSADGAAVDLYDANVFALFQRRARGVSLHGGAPLITPISLTQLVTAQSPANQGGRFSAFASQTGDYGTIDVFRDGPRLLGLAADPWGFTTPASPGEAAHAGVWDLTSGTAVPVCLFDTYTRPADPGPFEALPHLTAWRAALDELRASGSPALGTAFLRDQGQLMADSAFVVLHMPLLARAQASVGNQTGWLRRRHDEVLDALFAWSAKDPANKAVFGRVFAQLRTAATELVHAYQTAQGLDAPEATQAGAIAVMELLYQASVTIAPALGGTPDLNESYKPRYPILASPQ
jgi:uncharacterized protein